MSFFQRAALAALTAFAALLSTMAAAGDAAATGLADYQHTQWTQENGAPAIKAMAQTTDGWLWLGTEDGLYRFDGVTFEHYAPPGEPSLSHRWVSEIHAADNGDLFIGYATSDMAVAHRDGRFERLPQPAHRWFTYPQGFAIDRDGSVWVGSRTVHHLVDGHWIDVDMTPAWPADGATSILLDQDARLWISDATGTWRLNRADGRFEKVTERGGDLVQAPNGDVWALAAKGGAAVRVAASASGKPRPLRSNAMSSRYAGQFDANGMLWALNCPDPVCLVQDAAARTTGAVLPQRDAGERLAGLGIVADRESDVMLEDREGNIWIVSRSGLHRFRPKRFLSSGLSRSGAFYNMATDNEGQAWAADNDTGMLWRLRPGQATVAQPGPWIGFLATARDGALLMGGKRSIFRRLHGVTEEIALPPGRDGKLADVHMIGMLDDGKVLWTATRETGLIGWISGKWLPSTAFNLPQQIYSTNTDGPGRLWLATYNRGLILYDHGRQTQYDLGPLGIVTGIFPGRALAVSGDGGLAVLKDGRLQLLRSADPDALRNVSGLVLGADGDCWLNGPSGVVHVRAADWQRALARPDQPLRYELFGAVDGYPGRATINNRLPTAFTADGRNLWFIASGGVVGLDSMHLRRNLVAPTPVVLEVVTDSARFTPSSSPGAVLRLPPGSDSFRMQFTAPALRQPDRVRFQYRLDRIDTHWRDAGTRRSTSYTNIAPGSYVFRVRAMNEDGVASRDDVALPLSIAPTLVQSLPFRIACALALLALATLLYRLRVRYLTRQLTARVTERMQVKLAERERIARTLHDTILQTVQALILRLDALAGSMPAGDRVRDALNNMLGDARSAVGEGRDQVHELRTTAAPALEDRVRACIGELQPLHPDNACRLHVHGTARALHMGVADEAYEIMREALRNAFAHARARRIDVRIEYGQRMLVLEVQDDGDGLDAGVAHAGYRSGHWGLPGMRERAANIGASLQLASAGGRGTTVTLTVPAARAYIERAA